MPLDQAQLRAVRHRNGPMLVLAGPGSGKTTVIINRILFLMNECRVPPEEILVITFTKAAAREMQERCQKKMTETSQAYGKNSASGRCPADGIPPVSERSPASAAFPVFGTFHSYFFSVLRRHCGFSSKSLVQTKTQYEILKKVLQDPQIPMIYTDDIAEVLLSEISRAKNDGGFPAGGVRHEKPAAPRHEKPAALRYEKSAASQYETPTVPEQELSAVIYRRYNAMLRSMKLLDFDDMLLLCRDLFLEHPECLLEEQRRFRYLLVDEFQDINALQYEIMRMIAKPRNNLFIVGDDDQSIYGFRGSKPSIMLGFGKDYPGARSVLLSKNYRSGAPIVEASARLISHNRTRFRKQIMAGRELSASVLFKTCGDEQAELRCLCELILNYRKRGVPFSEIAVLSRTNTEAAAVKACLNKAEIPFSEAGKGNGKKTEETAEKAQGAEKAKGAEKTQGAEKTERAPKIDHSSGGICLATFHSSKGLEFTAVIIIAANEGITPHRKSDSGALLEEERRMFYVAATRAKQYLHILDTKSRYNKPQKRSRFVDEMRNAPGLRCRAGGRTDHGKTKNTGGR